MLGLFKDQRQVEWLELNEQEEGDREGSQMQAGAGPWSLQAKGPGWAQPNWKGKPRKGCMLGRVTTTYVVK